MQTEAPAETGAPDRSTLLQELSSLPNDAPEEKAPEPVESETPTETPAEESEGENPEPEEAAPEKELEDEEKAEPELETAPTEPEVKIDEKRLAAIHAQEKRVKDMADRRESELAQREQQITAKAQQIEDRIARFEKAQETAKYDPVALLEELGVFNGDDDYEAIARSIYHRGPKGKDQPGSAAQAREMMHRRRQQTELEKTQLELRQIKEQMQHQSEQKMVDDYLDGVTRAVSDDHPFSKSLLASDKAEARAELLSLTKQMHDMTGEVPDASDVVAEFEKRQVQAIKKRGIDPAMLARSTKNENPNAGEKKSAKRKTLSNELGKSTKPAKEITDPSELRDDIIRSLEKGELE